MDDNIVRITKNFRYTITCNCGKRNFFVPYMKIKCLHCNKYIEYKGKEHQENIYLKVAALKLKKYSEIRIVYPISLGRIGQRVTGFMKMYGLAEKNMKRIKENSLYVKCKKCFNFYNIKKVQACPKCNTEEHENFELELIEVTMGR